MALDLQAITALRDAIRRVIQTSSETERSLATCVRVDKDGTRWVRVLGSDTDTPVNGTQLSEMAEGDMVEVSFDNGSLSVYGNVSSPSVGRVEVAESERRTEERIATVRAELVDADQVQAREIRADKARIGDLEADTADIDTIRANAAKVQNLTAAQLEADHATIGSLSTNYAHITNGVIDNATIGYADVNNLSAHYAEIQNGKIDSALIDTAAIVDEQVFTVTGNKATISEINADTITVRNLHTSNLTVDTANGYVTIGNKQTPTKEFIDSLKDELQQEIDGAVETFTSSAVPLLNNYPASEWIVSGATAEEQRRAYAKHVGDICYVQNSALDQNGYAYRFAYDSTEQTFKWVLIKDSDVTKALGDISDLKTFESDTTTWMEETDEGLTTIRQNHTALSGVVDKTVVETKQLWFTKSNTTAPNKPTAQVTSTSTAGNAWRVVVPAYNASYPNYYYCLQYKLADGTYAWSDVVRDIAMGESQQQGRKGVADAATADGKAVAAQTTADGAATAAATADGKAVSAQTTANANIKSSVQLWFTKANTTAPNKPTAQVTVNDATKTNQWNLAIPTYNASYPNYFYCYQQQKGDGTWQWTDVVYDRSITEAQAKAQAALPSSEFNTFKTTTFKEVVDEVDEQSSTISTLSETVSTKADQSTVTTLSNTVNTVQQTANANTSSISSLQTTVSGHTTTISQHTTSIQQNATDISLRATKTEASQMAQPNLAPLGSADFASVYNATTNPKGYWKTTIGPWFTRLDDGWIHVYVDNTAGTAAVNSTSFRPSPSPSVVPSGVYTILTEIRNNASAGDASTDMYLQQIANNQFWGNVSDVVIDDEHVTTSTQIPLSTCGASYVMRSYRIADTTHLTDGVPPSELFRYNFRCAVGAKLDFDFRMSLYDGIYDGPYKPYIGTQLYASQAELKVANDAISMRVEKNDVINQINVSTEGVQIDASKVQIDGTAIFTAISSDVDSAITGKGYATTTQAQGYASTAKSEAISAAATDATTKANAAENNAKAYTDALEIGGRNLLYDTAGWSKWAKTTKATEADDVLTCVNTDTSSGFQRANGWFIPDKADVMDREIVISFDAKKTDSTALSSLVFQMFTTSAAPKSVASGNINEGTRYYINLSTTSTSKVTILNASEINATTWTRVSIRFVPSQVFNTSYTEQAYLAVYIGINNTVASAQFRHIKVEYGNRATDWTAAPEDIEANAVKRTQRIWYRKSESGAPSTPSTASSSWVTKADDGNDAWTKMHIAISSTHKYIYTCEQYEMANGTVGYTSVLLDNTITVIDGGNIITGSVTANKLNASDINASKSLTVGAMTDAAASTVLNSNVEIGGRNLLRHTGNPVASDLVLTRASVADGVITVTPTTSSSYAKFRVDYLDFDEYGEGEYTVSFDAKAVSGATYTQLKGPIVYAGFQPSSRIGNVLATSADRYVGYTLETLTYEWVRYSKTFTAPDSMTTGQASALASGSNLTIEFAMSGSYAPMQVRNVKLERGNKATDWTAAPEDVESSIVEASKTASNYITADSTGIKIHMSGSTSTYQHQSSTATTYYVNGNKRAEVGTDGLKVYVGTTGTESSVAEFGATARVGSASGPNVYVESGGVSVRDGTTGVVKFSGAAATGSYTRSSSVELAGWNGTALRMRGDLSTDNRYIGLESGFGSLLAVRHTDSVTEYGSFEGNDFVELEAEGMSVNGTTVDMDKQVLPAFLTQSGMVAQSISATANAVTSYTVTFPIPYEASPIVTACFYSTSTAAAFGGLSLAVSAITTTSFTVKIFNNTSTGRTLGIFWIAAPQTTLT